MSVPNVAEEQTTQWPHQKSGCENAERRDKRGSLIVSGKEQVGNRSREIAVDGEIEPFQDIADNAGGDSSLRQQQWCRRDMRNRHSKAPENRILERLHVKN